MAARKYIGDCNFLLKQYSTANRVYVLDTLSDIEFGPSNLPLALPTPAGSQHCL